jgi:hypothetical protein
VPLKANVAWSQRLWWRSCNYAVPVAHRCTQVTPMLSLTLPIATALGLETRHTNRRFTSSAKRPDGLLCNSNRRLFSGYDSGRPYTDTAPSWRMNGGILYWSHTPSCCGQHGITWRRVFSLTLRPVQTLLQRSRRFKENKEFIILPGFEPRSSSPYRRYPGCLTELRVSVLG